MESQTNASSGKQKSENTNDDVFLFGISRRIYIYIKKQSSSMFAINSATFKFRSLKVGLQPSILTKKYCRYTKSMAQTASTTAGKKLIKIDVTSDSVCPWCYVGKKNLDKALALSNDQYDFEINWHPFLLNPSAPKEGINKIDYYRSKFGSRADQMSVRMSEVFKGVGMEYSMAGLTGSSLDSHRLILFAGKQGLDKQHNLVEELFKGYFTQGKFIGDRDFLVESARKVGIEGAVEFLNDPKKGLDEVNEELKKYSANISGVPHYVINGKHQLSGGQPSEVFLRAFQVAAK